MQPPENPLVKSFNIRSQLRQFMPAGGMGRQIGWVMIQAGVETGLMTIAVFLTARLFGDVLLGQLGVFLAGVQLITMMGDGLYPGIIRQVSGEHSTNQQRATKMGWILCWTTICLGLGVTCVLGIAAIGIGGTFGTISWVLLAAAIAVLRVARTSFESAFRAMGEFKWPCIAGATSIGAGAVLIVILAIQGYRVSMYLSVQAGALLLNSIILAILFARMLRRTGAASLTIDEDIRKDFLSYTAPLVTRGVVSFLYLKVNIWLIWMMASDADAGQFRLVDQMLTLPRLVMSAALAAFAPRITPNITDPIRLGQITGKIQGVMLALSLPCSLLFIASPIVLLPLFPQFEPACRMLQYYAPVLPITGLAFAASILLTYGGFPKTVLWVSVGASIANVAGVYCGLYWNGVFGAMIAMSIIHGITGLVMISLAYRLLKLRFLIILKP